MTNFPPPDYLQSYWQDAFQLRQHLQGFLKVDAATLEEKLQAGQQAMALLGQHFEWDSSQDFYQDQVGAAYLFDLGAWHLDQRDYIGGTLQLVADQVRGRVLDFGGGIGTHALGAALCPAVTEVVCCDINPVNLDFVQYRATAMGLGKKLSCVATLSEQETFDTILCFDVLEHLSDPGRQLLTFYQWLNADGRMITNWYFSKGYHQQFPFHLDDPVLIEAFFRTLQKNFLEVFHPYLLTARCYKKI